MEKHTPIVTDVTHFRKVGASMCITVPKGVRSSLPWAEGQALLIRVKGKRLVIESLFEHMANAIRQNEQQIPTRG